MTDYFTVDPACYDGTIDIDKVLDDTQELLSAGVEAASTLRDSQTFILPSTRRYLRNMANSFGIQYYPIGHGSGLTDTDRNIVSTVLSEDIIGLLARECFY